jgi:hypothetical protein
VASAGAQSWHARRSSPPKPARAVHSRYEVSACAQHLTVLVATVAEVPVGRGAKEETEALIVTSGILEGPDAVVHTQARGSTAKGIVHGDFHDLPVRRVGRATEHDVACVVEQAAPSTTAAGAVAASVLSRRTEQGALPVLGMRGDVRCGLGAQLDINITSIQHVSGGGGTQRTESCLADAGCAQRPTTRLEGFKRTIYL